MIKFIVAGLWLCAVSIGAVFYSFQMAGAKAAAEPDAGTARRPRLREDRRAFGAGAHSMAASSAISSRASSIRSIPSR